ncbi:glycosyltransferase family 4 protein [Phycisphaeraceae bacterium D3-23]
MPAHPPTIVVISQVYVPDPTAVGQHMHDACAELARRGYRVIVYTSRRGYDNPRTAYKRRETLDGVHIRRLHLSSFGKRSIKVRLAAQLIFLFQAVLRASLTRNFKTVLVTTSPPMGGVAGLLLKRLRGAKIRFWAMDINPDQAILMGKTTEDALVARAFNRMNRMLLRESEHVIALDHFMAGRLQTKYPGAYAQGHMSIIPPWPLGDHLEPIAHEDNPFRKEFGLVDQFVIMYSGNISPAHRIDTVLDAAKQFKDHPRLTLLFIGGDEARQRIDAYAQEHGLTAILRTLPYQPLDQIKYSLSAADVHLVSMGEQMAGIVHPCKIYGAMAVARPVLFCGIPECHIGEIVDRFDFGRTIPHGDTDAAARAIQYVLDQDPADLQEIGQRARDAMLKHYDKNTLCNQLCDLVEPTPPPGAMQTGLDG